MLNKMRILIRKAKKGDGKAFCEYWNEGLKRKFFVYNGGNQLRKKKDIAKADKRYASQDKHNMAFLALDKETGKIIGACSYFGKGTGRTRHRVELGWSVHPDYVGKGIATSLLGEALKVAKKKGFRRAEAEAAVENVASAKLAKKCGFKIEGKRKAGLLLDNGKYVDTYLFGKLLK